MNKMKVDVVFYVFEIQTSNANFWLRPFSPLSTFYLELILNFPLSIFVFYLIILLSLIFKNSLWCKRPILLFSSLNR